MTTSRRLEMIDTRLEEGCGPDLEIPSQRMPSVIRWVFRWILYLFMIFDLCIQKGFSLLFPPPFPMKGACKKRGACCHHILMAWPPYLDWVPFIARFYMIWMTEINGFYLKGRDIEDEVGMTLKVVGCRYLQKDGSCGNYRFRPAICRQYPRQGFFRRPRLMKGCGYRAGEPEFKFLTRFFLPKQDKHDA